MPDKICPCCGIVKIQVWETVCLSCYRLIGEFDRKFGTDYQIAINEGKFILIQNLNLQRLSIFYPLSYNERMMRVKKVAKFCVDCQMRVEQRCDSCIWHKIMNSIAGTEIW